MLEPARMIYYTIYVRNLQNGTGYIDVSLEDDQLMKDFQTFLDVGLRSHKVYKVATPAGTPRAGGVFSINVSEVVAIMTVPPAKAGQ